MRAGDFRKYPSGFTLLEQVIVVVIVCVLAMIATRVTGIRRERAAGHPPRRISWISLGGGGAVCSMRAFMRAATQTLMLHSPL